MKTRELILSSNLSGYFNLRTGSLVIASYLIISYTLVLLIRLVLECAMCSLVTEDTVAEVDQEDLMMAIIKNFLNIICSLIMLGSAILLFNGIYEDNPSHMVPWLLIKIYELTSDFFNILSNMLYQETIKHFFRFGFTLYIFMVLMMYYKVLKETYNS